MASRRVYVDFAEIKQKVSIPQVLEIFGIADRFERNGNKLHGVCPLPSHVHNNVSSNPEQFKIDFKEGCWLWHCFSTDCNKGGDVIELVKHLAHLDNAHVRLWFAEKFPELARGKPNVKAKPADAGTATTATEVAPATPVKAVTEAPSNQPSAKAGEDQSLQPLRFYLNLSSSPYLTNERGLKPDTIERFGVGLCTKSTLFAGYIAIPIYAHPHQAGSNPIAYIGRWPGEDYSEAEGKPRYRLPPNFPKSRVVYGLHVLNQSERKPLLVVEGCFDVFSLWQNGGYEAVAILGSSLSEEQAAILASLQRPLCLMLDGDAAGIAGARLAAAKLMPRTFVRAIKLAEEEQPDRLSPARLTELLSFLA